MRTAKIACLPSSSSSDPNRLLDSADPTPENVEAKTKRLGNLPKANEAKRRKMERMKKLSEALRVKRQADRVEGTGYQSTKPVPGPKKTYAALKTENAAFVEKVAALEAGNS